MPHRIAYLPLNTYPEAAPDPAILAAVGFAAGLGCALHVATFAVDVPQTVSPISGYFINVEGMARTAEDRSKAESARLQALIAGALPSAVTATTASHTVVLGAAPAAAATEARLFDLVLVPWSDNTLSAQDMAQVLVFDAGVPVILIPPTAKKEAIEHIAVAWDGSRVAARALQDALPLLAPGGRISVLTVQDEKALGALVTPQTLAVALDARGYAARAVSVTLDGRPIATALQDASLSQGAQLMAMGGFGHSRLRDFILGGATKGVLADLRLPVLLAH